MSRVRRFVDSHSIAFFVFGAYSISWSIWFVAHSVPGIVYNASLGVGTRFSLQLLVFLLGNFGPAISATVVLGIAKGSGEVSKLWRGLTTGPDRAITFLAAATLLPCLYLFALLLYSLIGGHIEPVAGSLRLSPWIAMSFPFAPIGEEIGWRGFLLPRLESTRNSLRASLIVALIWMLWHFPFYWHSSRESKMWFGIQVTAFAILFTWIYNASRPSLLPCILSHAIADIGSLLLIAPTAVKTGMPIVRIETTLLALAAIAIMLSDPTLGQGHHPNIRREPTQLD